MNQTLCFLFVAASCFSVGCSEQPVAPANIVAEIEAPQQEKEPQGESSIGDKIGNFAEQMKSKALSMDDVKSALNGVGDTTAKTTDDVMNWATEQFKLRSEQGQTQAKNVQDWLTEDWNNASAWEYEVIRLDDSTPASLQKKLNEAGKQRWDCFHVTENPTGTTFYMKRQRKSYMKNLPLRDVLKLLPLVPLLDGE